MVCKRHKLEKPSLRAKSWSLIGLWSHAVSQGPGSEEAQPSPDCCIPQHRVLSIALERVGAWSD